MPHPPPQDRSDPAPEVSVVVPVYQSAASVAELVARTARLFDEALQRSFEVILIDDGSTAPDTWDTLAGLARADPRVRAIRLVRNFGKPVAVLCGLAHSRGAWVVTIDDDLQQAPEDIATLLEHGDHDVVVAAYAEKRHSRAVALTSRIKRMFDAHVLGLPLQMTPLKLIRRPVVDNMLRMRAGRPYIPALLTYVTRDFKAVPLSHHPSRAGRSRYGLGRRLRQFSNLMISHSGLFARVWGLIGLTALAAAGLVGLGGMLAWLRGGGPPGIHLALLVIPLAMGGMILMALGVVGEYLIRLVELTSDRPLYVIRDSVDSRGAQDPS